MQTEFVWMESFELAKLPVELVVKIFSLLSGAGCLVDFVSLWNTRTWLRPLVEQGFSEWAGSPLLETSGSSGVLTKAQLVFLEKHNEGR
jgi:hypothetical protein